MTDDEKFMQEALKEAKIAYEADEVPVGAVLVLDGKVIARAHNLVETLKDASAHAELICLKEASKVLGNWRLLGCTLYSTLEPCCMCAGALILARISTLVWSAPDLRVGANGSFVDLLGKDHPIHTLEVRRGVLQEESSALMRSFFQKKRRAHAGAL